MGAAMWSDGTYGDWDSYATTTTTTSSAKADPEMVLKVQDLTSRVAKLETFYNEIGKILGAREGESVVEAAKRVMLRNEILEMNDLGDE